MGKTNSMPRSDAFGQKSKNPPIESHCSSCAVRPHQCPSRPPLATCVFFSHFRSPRVLGGIVTLLALSRGAIVSLAPRGACMCVGSWTPPPLPLRSATPAGFTLSEDKRGCKNGGPQSQTAGMIMQSTRYLGRVRRRSFLGKRFGRLR